MPERIEEDVLVSGYEDLSNHLMYSGESEKIMNTKKPTSHAHADGTPIRTRYVVRAVERPELNQPNADIKRPRHEFVITEILANGSSKDLFRSNELEDLTDIISTARIPVECEGDLIKKLLDGFTTTEIAEHVYGEK